MKKYLDLNKYTIQLKYIDSIWDILQNEKDGNLYNELSEEDTERFDDFLNFLGDLQINIEKKLNKVTNEILKVS